MRKTKWLKTIPPEETVDQENPKPYVTTGRIVGDYYNSVKVSKSIKWDGYAYCPHRFNHHI
jgi:hypothetical protein